MRSYRSILWKVPLLMLLTIFSYGCSVFGIRTYEMPQYDVLLKEGNKEIRHYDSFVVAKTTVAGEFKEAQSAGFRILANYIFGDNQKQQEIKMTAPVVQKSGGESEKIPMTAPVIQRPGGDGWVMTFMMPSDYKIEDLPVPNDERVSLEAVPARYTASIRYTWLGSKARNDEKADALQAWLTGLEEFEPISSPMYAGYDPPWTLPFLRRNEIMIDVRRLPQGN
jgi:hypothetical protein